MSASQERQPTLESVAPRFLVGDMEQALAFYGQLGFATTSDDEGFAILERDGISLHFNVSDPGDVLGTKGFWLCDPFRAILIFEESIPEGESDTQQGA